jgi:hypothetical protein
MDRLPKNGDGDPSRRRRGRETRTLFDWQVEDESGRWVTLATVRRRPRPHALGRVPWRAWGIVVVALIAGVSAMVAYARHRYRTAYDRLAFQIQGVMDVEAHAIAQGDRARFLEQQDETSPGWYAEQARRVSAWISPLDRQTLSPSAQETPIAPRIRSMDVRGDVAWVEVVNGRDQVVQVRFYRRTDRGWKHTAPQPEFWQEPVELGYGNLSVRCHRRDLPHIEPLVEHVRTVLSDVCAMAGCPVENALELDVVPASTPTALSGSRLVLASPWLTGIPADGTWDQAYLDTLTYWVTYQVVERAARTSAHRDLAWFEKGIIGEFSALYTHQHCVQDPVLRHYFEQQCLKQPPSSSACSSFEGVPVLSRFLDRWLSLAPPGEPVLYLDSLRDDASPAHWPGN